jgi:hypothetical protein
MALHDALALAGVTATGVSLAGPNPSLAVVDDNGGLYRSRTGLKLAVLSTDGLGSFLQLLVGNNRGTGTETITTDAALRSNTIATSASAVNSTNVANNMNYIVRPSSHGSGAGYRGLSVLTTMDALFPATFDGILLSIRSGLIYDAPQSATNSIVTTLSSLQYGGNFASPAVINSAVCLSLQCDFLANSSGTVTTQRALLIQSATKSGSSTAVLGTQTALEILPQSLVCTNQHCLRIGAATNGSAQNAAIHINSNSANAGAGIVWGQTYDTFLWRGAANQLATPGDLLLRHGLSSSVPSIAAGAGAGTSPTLTLDRHTDKGFRVTLIQGNPTATGVIFTLTFGASFTVAPACTYSPSNATAAALGTTSVPFVTTTSTTAVFNSGSVGLVAGSTYVWLFVVAC